MRGAQASQPDAEQKAVEKAEDEDDLFWEELMPYSIPNAAFSCKQKVEIDRKQELIQWFKHV